jgi:hypothetical protein
MRRSLLLVWFFSFSRIFAQLIDQSVDWPLIRGGREDIDIRYVAFVEVSVSQSSLDYRVDAGLVFERGAGVFLTDSGRRTDLPPGLWVGNHLMVYTNSSTGYSWEIGANSYAWTVRFPGNQIFVSPTSDGYPAKTVVHVGFARQHPVYAGTQYGWVRLERETADTKNAFREDGTAKQITFMPTAFAVNPIPDQPIRAGEPPDLPQLVSEVLPPEDGHPTRVRVSWASGWSSMRLESALELGNPVQWSPVFEVTGTEAVFELPEDGQLYLRLAYVP